jgi:DNA replication protein DnaC
MNVQHERIEAMCRTLKLERVAAEYDAIAQAATREELAYSDFLERTLAVEIGFRVERTREVLARMACFPTIKTLEQFDFGFAAGVPKAQMLELASLTFIERAENVVLIGPREHAT